MAFFLDTNQKKQFAGIFLLEKIINEKKAFDIFLENNDKDLEPVFEYLMMHSYIKIKNEKFYIETEKGNDLLKKFALRYRDFLRFFDIYNAVDLAEGAFAFESYFDFEVDQQWQIFLQDQRWEDLRIAVAVFKKINPIEIVFMSFIREKRFGFTEKSGWQFDLLLGSVWEEILDICNTALKMEELAYFDEEIKTNVSGEEVIKDIIIQGAQLNKKLFQKEGERDNQLNGFCGSLEEIRENILKTYDNYLNPYYLPDYWKGGILN